VSARATIDDLATPHPLGLLLPGLYHDNDIAQRFTGALDVVLAPVLATLDSSDAYVDPRLAPLDFVAWLAEWVGVELDASWPEERQRALVARAADLFAWRGTVRGVADAVAIYTGVVPEIAETGAAFWTGTPPPSGSLPGSPAGELVVRVRVPPGQAGTIDPARLDRLVAAAKPAHIAHRVEIYELTEPAAPPRRRSSATGSGSGSGSGSASGPGSGTRARAARPAEVAIEPPAVPAVEPAPSRPPEEVPPPDGPDGPDGSAAGQDLDGDWPDDPGPPPAPPERPRRPPPPPPAGRG
jgi:phage tail-like protein